MEDLTANNIALSILVLKGEHGKDWRYQSEMSKTLEGMIVSWDILLWTRRN